MDGSFLYSASYAIHSKDNMLDQAVYHRNHTYGQILMTAKGTKISGFSRLS